MSAGRKKISGPPRGGPEYQAYLRVPSIPSVAWYSVAVPPRTVKSRQPISPHPAAGGLIEDGSQNRPLLCRPSDLWRRSLFTRNVGRDCEGCKRKGSRFCLLVVSESLFPKPGRRSLPYDNHRLS